MCVLDTIWNYFPLILILKPYLLVFISLFNKKTMNHILVGILVCIIGIIPNTYSSTGDRLQYHATCMFDCEHDKCAIHDFGYGIQRVNKVEFEQKQAFHLR